MGNQAFCKICKDIVEVYQDHEAREVRCCACHSVHTGAVFNDPSILHCKSCDKNTLVGPRRVDGFLVCGMCGEAYPPEHVAPAQYKAKGYPLMSRSTEEIQEDIMKARNRLILEEPNDISLKAVKHDQDKLRFDLLPPDALASIVAVLTYGAKKYDDRNWEKGLPWGRLFGAIQRHLWAFWGGEDVDSKSDGGSGLHHLAHAACGLMMLLEHTIKGLGEDDRPEDMEGQ